MNNSSGCIGCVTGEKASQSVNFILEKKSRKTFVIGLKAPIILKSRKFFEKFSKNFENSKIIIKILTSGESLWYFNDNQPAFNYVSHTLNTSAFQIEETPNP